MTRKMPPKTVAFGGALGDVMSVIEQRGESYGGESDGYENLRRIARLWSAYLDVQVTAHDVTWLMTLLKASRSRQDPDHVDNYTDAAGYVDLARALSEFP